MTVKLFAIRDTKVGAFMQPFFGLTIGQAARSFGDHVQDSNNAVSKHPGDYELYALGEFDDNTGKLTSLEEPQRIAQGSDFIPTGNGQGR